jgi:hypothetical protein
MSGMKRMVGRERDKKREEGSDSREEAAARGGRGRAARQAAPPPQGAPRRGGGVSSRPAETRPATRGEQPRPREGAREGESEGGWGGRGSVAPDVERLHRREAHQTGGERGGAAGADAIRTAGEQEREGAEESEERTGRRRWGWVGWMLLYNHNHHERARERMGRRGEGGRLPRPPPLRSSTVVPPTTRPDIPAGKYSGYSGRPTPTGRYSGAGRRILWELAPGS